MGGRGVKHWKKVCNLVDWLLQGRVRAQLLPLGIRQGGLWGSFQSSFQRLGCVFLFY